MLVCGILAVLWLSETPETAIGFSLSAPTVIAPGSDAALRSWRLLEEGIAAPTTTVEVRDATGTVIGETTLIPSRTHGSEGDIALPGEISGVISFTARTTIDDEPIAVSYSVSLDAQNVLRAARPMRETSPFQVYELGPLRVDDPDLAPQELDPRIEEGACVPDLPCWLSVWVGDSRAHVRLVALAGVRLQDDEQGPRSGFLRFPITVVGNEALLRVEALGPEDQVVASRDVRLPIVPGGIMVQAEAHGRRVQLDWEEVEGRGPVLVDAYLGNRWTHALSVTPDDPWLPVALEPGVWRLQLRNGLFSSNTAGVTHVVITQDDDEDPLETAARAVLDDAARDGLDPLAVAIEEGRVSPEHSEEAIRALFGPKNFGVLSLSGVVSQFRLEPDLVRQVFARWIAALLILGIGVLVSLFLFRVDAHAQARAREILDAVADPDSGDDGNSIESPRKHVRTERWLWAFVLLVFALVAVLALSKGWF